MGSPKPRNPRPASIIVISATPKEVTTITDGKIFGNICLKINLILLNKIGKVKNNCQFNEASIYKFLSQELPK